MTQESANSCCSCFRKTKTRHISLSEVQITENMEMMGIRTESEMVPAAYWKYEIISRLRKLREDLPAYTWINSVLMKI